MLIVISSIVISVTSLVRANDLNTHAHVNRVYLFRVNYLCVILYIVSVHAGGLDDRTVDPASGERSPWAIALIYKVNACASVDRKDCV